MSEHIVLLIDADTGEESLVLLDDDDWRRLDESVGADTPATGGSAVEPGGAVAIDRPGTQPPTS
jgi:hypothetical protein